RDWLLPPGERAGQALPRGGGTGSAARRNAAPVSEGQRPPGLRAAPRADREHEQLCEAPVQLASLSYGLVRYPGDALPGVRARIGPLLSRPPEPGGAARVRRFSQAALRYRVRANGTAPARGA